MTHPSPAVASRTLSALAWSNVALHGVGLALAWWGMRPGSIAVPLADRLTYLADRPAGWTWGWGAWMVCTLLLVAFMAALRSRLPAPNPAADLALAFAAAGMGVDLLCDVIQIQVLPLLAAAGPDHAALFLAFERLAFTGGATVANGLYTAGVALMTVAARGAIGAPARWAGWATAFSGTALAIAGLIVSPLLIQASTGPTLGFYGLWTVLVARDFGRSRA
jgi:hypothetical protein